MISLFAGIILIAAGLYFIFLRLNHLKSNPPFILYVAGIPSKMNKKAPIEALPLSDRHAKTIEYSVDSYRKDELIRKYAVMSDNFEEKVEHRNASKLYVASLGSFPSLFLIGSLVRNAHMGTIQIMEYDRNKPTWHLLNEISNQNNIEHLVDGEKLNISTIVNALLESNPEEVGIALAYTFDIPKEQIPHDVREHTLILTHSYGYGHDLLSSKDTQKILLGDLAQLLTRLSRKTKRIHLFAAAQASFSIALGKNYMDNANGTLVLHNYDSDSGSYNWSIEFNKGVIK